jgi:hypothetical protein
MIPEMDDVLRPRSFKVSQAYLHALGRHVGLKEGGEHVSDAGHELVRAVVDHVGVVPRPQRGLAQARVWWVQIRALGKHIFETSGNEYRFGFAEPVQYVSNYMPYIKRRFQLKHTKSG